MLQRDALCRELIVELDERVFEKALPDDLELIWSKRLNTTAGRARWKRIRLSSSVTGEAEWRHDAKVELSTKVLDSEEKLRNTLAHELCVSRPFSGLYCQLADVHSVGRFSIS